MQTVDIAYPLFKTPGSLLICGPSFSGKSTLLARIFKNKNTLFTDPKPAVIIYCFSEQPSDIFKDINNLILHEGLPTEDTINQWIAQFGKTTWLLAFDDMQDIFYESNISKNLLTKLCHHHNCYCIVLGHNLFAQGKYARTVSLNFHYFILTRNCRDINQISHFGYQVFGKGFARKFLNVYLDATEIQPNHRPGYLLITSHPLLSQRNYRLFTHIFEDNLDGPLMVYKLV